MEYFTFLLYTILFLSILTPVVIVIFDFFDVKFETYGSYLFWVIALALFNALLPYQPKNIFEDAVAAVAAVKPAPASAPSVISNKK